MNDAPRQPTQTALDVALLVMQNGGSTALADETFRNVLKGSGNVHPQAVWRIDGVAASSGAAEPMIERPVGATELHLDRASAAAELGMQIACGAVERSAVPAEIQRIRGMARSYPQWLTPLLAALAGAFFAKSAGADWGAFGVAFVAAGVGQALRVTLEARDVARFPLIFLCAVVSALVGTAGLRLEIAHPPSATLVASVIYMVPGLALINGFIDVMSTKQIIAGMERLLDAALVFMLLAIALAIADAAL
jgi:uncharacterized membrane protein YjjP (DUF1212 family)